MTGNYVLKTKVIPWKYLDKFNSVASFNVPRHCTDPTRPGLLARNWIGDFSERNIGLLEADMSEGKRGFTVGLVYECGMEEIYPVIRKIAANIRKAVRETTGRQIRTAYIMS